MVKWMDLWRQIRRLRISLHAAHTGYFLILSLFPTLVLLLSLLRYTRFTEMDLVALLEGLIPPALLPEAEVLIHQMQRNSSSALVSLSAFGALWSASRGIQGLREGLNAIYGVEENRGYFRTRFLSVFYTVAFLLYSVGVIP